MTRLPLARGVIGLLEGLDRFSPAIWPRPPEPHFTLPPGLYLTCVASTDLVGHPTRSVPHHLAFLEVLHIV